MNWCKAPADTIETLPRGTRVRVNGLEYIRMADSPSSHIEGYLFYPEDGWWGHWSRIAYGIEVEVPDELCGGAA